MVAAVVQYISADVYIPALRILLRANRSSPVFFSLRARRVISCARAIQFFLSQVFFRCWGKFFFPYFFRGCRSMPRPLFAPLCGKFGCAREKKPIPLAVETVERRTDTSPRDLERVRGAKDAGFESLWTTAEKKKKKKKEMKTLN